MRSTTSCNVSRKSRNGLEHLLNQKLISDETFDLSVARDVLEGIDHPTSLGIYLCLKYGDHASVIKHEIDPSNYLNWRDYFDAKQSVALLSKYPFKTVVGVNPTKVAKDAFFYCEDACKEVNERFRLWSLGAKAPGDIDAAIFAARWKIQNLLRSFDPLEWSSSCRFGPGAVFGTSGESDYQKLRNVPSVTPEFSELGRSLLNESPVWMRSLTYDRNDLTLNVIPGGKYSQVPKNAKTNRNIETQPLLNGYAQLGIGMMLRRRLKKAGIDLDDQSRNQSLARDGSIDGILATMDLSNASDTIATELVRALLPTDWFFAMDSCRTRRISFDKQYRPLERFCSMGNGFAFELESLIFWALSSSAIENLGQRVHVSVYGDDIIIPSKYFDTVARTLQYCGFSVNTKKSFSSGYFRESCGADWFDGHSVRPFFLKKGSTNVASLISLANGLARASWRRNQYFYFSRQFARAWFRVVRRIPIEIRRRIAFGYSEHDDIILSTRDRDGCSIVFKSKKLAADSWYTGLATALYRLDRRSATEDTYLHVAGNIFDAHFLDKGNGHIYDYRRNHGSWCMRSAQAVIRPAHTTMWW